MKSTLHVCGFILVLIFFTSCGEHVSGGGEMAIQTFLPVSNFTKISVDHDIDVTIKYSSTKKVEVSGYKNLVEKVRVSATGGTLRIGMKEEYTYDNMNLTAVVSVPSFSQIFITHDGNVEIDSFSTYFTNLHFGISGNGTLTSLKHIQSQTITADLTGAGSATINGACVNLDIEVTNSGNWNGFDQFSSYATVKTTNSGMAEVNPKMNLNATITGAGNIYYKRYPVILSSVTGSGAVIDGN